MNGVRRLGEAGVSVWLDDLGRDRLDSGGLARLVEQGVSGVTTNPTIFAKAVGDGAYYASDLADLAARGVDAETAVFALATEDVRRACDVLSGVYAATDRVDGRVSLEVDPRLAHDPAATIEQARRLWHTVDRPNLMVKVPATLEGLPAITALLGEGLSINVTLIFALERYDAVLDAWLAGLQQARDAGRDLASIGSVASFFVSRVDTMVDPMLQAAVDGGDSAATRSLGTAALANARLAYQHFLAFVERPEWRELAALGAQPQRPLWASTSTKNPAYDPTMYVTGLVGPHTVNTLPAATLDAVLEDPTRPGAAADTVSTAGAASQQVMAELAEHGVDMSAVVTRLESEGVASFAASWVELIAAVERALVSARP